MRGTDRNDRATASDRLNRVAPLLFVLLWSSSFLGTRVGLRHMSPLWFVALRMILTAILSVAVMTVLRRPWSLSRTAWFHCAVVGVSTQAILLMTAHVAMTRTEAAPIAIISAVKASFLSCKVMRSTPDRRGGSSRPGHDSPEWPRFRPCVCRQ